MASGGLSSLDQFSQQLGHGDGASPWEGKLAVARQCANKHPRKRYRWDRHIGSGGIGNNLVA